MVGNPNHRKQYAIMVKYVENFVGRKRAARVVPSSRELDVPNSPTVPTHTYILKATKLKEIEKFPVQQR